MPDTHLFLSDAHYGAFDDKTNREIETDLIALADYCLTNDIQLYLLGDLFDYWMEYPGHHPDYGDRILEAFQRYMNEKGPVLYITGNHDNWTRGYLEETGFEVEADYRLIRLDDRQIFLQHGDGLKDPDLNLPRPLFHRFLRNPLFVGLYQTLLPPGAGLRLMQYFSAYSRSRPVFQPERLSKWAEEYLGKSKTDFVICGHDHVPRIETFRGGMYLNSGPFYSQRTMAAYTNGQFELVVWNSSGKKLTAFQQNNGLYKTNR